jgi:3-dehydroquinate dehydratase I
MICTSIGKPTVKNCQQLLENRAIQLAEIRLDGAQLTTHDVKLIFTLPIKLIATCRPTPDRTEAQRKQLLFTAIEAGAHYVDIEIEADDLFKQEIIKFANESNCQVIISYHNFELTPPQEQLKQIVTQCFQDSAHIAKIACQVNSKADSARILSLYAYNVPPVSHNSTHAKLGAPKRLILAIGMGEEGKVTRIAAPLLGAPFTFAPLSRGAKTAPGQLDRTTLANIYRLMEAQ